jgi:putative nucleotidyltransferase with HDIG domain
LVNSPYYGIREEVTGCRQAITLLGFDTVKNLSVCVSVVSACLPDETVNPELDLRELWKHSITTGVIADQIAARAQVENPDAAFTAGVLHDIGKFVMNIALRKDYGDVIALARNEGLFLREAEDSLVGANHQYFGAFLARMWGFPAQLVEAIEKHHDESRTGAPLGVVETVSMANRVARMLKVGSSGDTRSLELGPDTFAILRLAGEEADRFLSEVRGRVEDARDMMNLVG